MVFLLGARLTVTLYFSRILLHYNFILTGWPDSLLFGMSSHGIKLNHTLIKEWQGLGGSEGTVFGLAMTLPIPLLGIMS